MGVTKQNKPRKRQPHACLYCREKKTKCEIGHDRNGPCVTCAKAHRECKWSTGSRPLLEPGLRPDALGIKRRLPSEDESPSRQPPASSPYSPRQSSSMPMKLEERSAKKLKSPATGYIPTLQPLTYTHINTPSASSHGSSEYADPYQLRPTVTLHLLDLYFRYRDTNCTQSLPRANFLNWVRGKSQKSPDEIMMLNSCLAVAALYTLETDLKEVGRLALEFAIKMEAARRGAFTLQLAQTQLNLSICHWAVAESLRAFDYTAGACRALSALNYETEQGCNASVSQDPLRNDYYLNAAQLVECRRRTFWIGYLTERYTGYFTGHTGLLSDEDITVRVPNNETDYDNGLKSVGHMFDDGGFSLRGCGKMARLLGIVSIWGVVTKEIYQSTYRLRLNPAEHYERHYSSVYRRLNEWSDNLPADMRESAYNTTASIKNETFPEYYVLQAGYHLTLMKLNRYCPFENLPLASVQRNLIRARQAASSFLNILSGVSSLGGARLKSGQVSYAILQPISGSSITVACDILTCGGPREEVSSVAKQLGMASEVVDEIAQHYKNAAPKKQKIHLRKSELSSQMATKAGKPWHFDHAMEESFTLPKHDAMYGTSHEVFYSALVAVAGPSGRTTEALSAA